MAAKLEKLETNKVKLEVNVSPEDFKAGVNKAYQKQKGKFNIPGFRKGKAPRAIVENFYGPHIFYEDAFEEVFPDAYRAAIEEHSLDVVSRPENVDILKLDADEGVVFTAEVFLRPEVKLGKYDGIKVTKETKNITAKEVDEEIEKVRGQNVRWVDVDRAAKDGDTVVIDYSGSVDGVKFDGGTAEKQSLEIGSKRFIPGFEEQIIGLKKGESRDINVKFPDEYTPELAGKDAVFAITLHEVKEKELPVLDDEFAQDVSEFDTLAEYKKDVKAKLQKQADEHTKMDMENQVLQKLTDDAKVEIPAVMIDGQIDYQIQDMQYRLMYQGIQLDDYLKHTDMTMDQLRDSYREGAEQQVKMRLAVEELMKELKIDPTPEQVESKLEELAKEAGKTVQEYKNMMGNEELDQFKDRVAMEQVFDYLVEHANITEGKKAPAQKAAGTGEKKTAEKKPAAKKPAVKTEAKTADKKPAAKPAAKKSASTAKTEKPAAKKTTEKKPE